MTHIADIRSWPTRSRSYMTPFTKCVNLDISFQVSHISGSRVDPAVSVSYQFIWFETVYWFVVKIIGFCSYLVWFFRE